MGSDKLPEYKGNGENSRSIPTPNEVNERGSGRWSLKNLAAPLIVVSCVLAGECAFALSAYRLAEYSVGTAVGVIPLVAAGGVMLSGALGMVLGAEVATSVIRRFNR